MSLAQGPQRSDTGEAQTPGLLFLSQALYHWATALPESLYVTVFVQNGDPNINII